MEKKLRVLWFSNVAFSKNESNSSGTWIHAMAGLLTKTGEIQLFNISQGLLKHTIRQDFNDICQWLLPYEPLRNAGLPSNRTVQEIQKIVNEVNPDIIHIWGTENYWGLLTARGYLKGNVVLEIQGLLFAIEKYFYSGLTILDILKCFRIFGLLKPSITLIGMKYSFKRWGKFEKEIILNHNDISTQSGWVRAYIRNVNPLARIHNATISLRTKFVEANKWELDSCVPYQIFTSSSTFVVYKGLHILIEAVAILKRRFPQIKLEIAGTISSGLRGEGYAKWLKRKIKHLGISQNITWTGPLDANDLVKHLHQANVAVFPSYIESYCLAFEEALTVGVPSVAAYSGAMPELATNENMALFFSPGDVVMCANAIERFFENPDYARIVSHNVYNSKKDKRNIDVVTNQLSIYNSLLM